MEKSSRKTRQLKGGVSAVLFDAGQTLIRVDKGVGRVYVETAARYGVRVVPEIVGASFRRLWEARRDSLHLKSSEAHERQWWRDLVADVFEAAGVKQHFGDRFEEFFNELYEWFYRAEAWRVYDDVLPALDMLARRGIRRAIVSNWDSRLPVLLERLDLRRRFEFVLTSAQAGYRKPDAHIFNQALARLNLEPSQVIYIGDSYEDDAVGAQNAGIKPILIDRDGTQPPEVDRIAVLTELDRYF
jgi:putative hydrolase of the HAD superfamily